MHWLETHPLSTQQVFQRLTDEGYGGGISIVKDYVRHIRPRPREAFLTLAFAPGEVAQVDWGEFGTIAVGDTRRRLSFFVMVLAWSRQMYVEFTLSQTMEQFLAAHVNAFNALGVPRKVMVDNLRCAVLRHPRGERAEFNPRYLDFARHYGFEIVACAVAKGNEKGRVERGVGYVKGNFLSGLDLPDFAALNLALGVWLESVANVRLHRETHRRPVDLWAEERAHLQAVNPRPFDVGRVIVLRANRQFRVSFEGNRYSVPARFAGRQVTVKVYPDRLCVYHAEELIARHARSFERHRDIEDPDHPKALVAQRRHARDAHVLKRFLALSAAGGDVPRRSAGAPRPCPGACAQDRCAGGDPRRRAGHAGDHRCAGLRGVQQRVHRASDRGARAEIARGEPAGVDASPGCAGSGIAAGRPVGLCQRNGR